MKWMSNPSQNVDEEYANKPIHVRRSSKSSVGATPDSVDINLWRMRWLTTESVSQDTATSCDTQNKFYPFRIFRDPFSRNYIHGITVAIRWLAQRSCQYFVVLACGSWRTSRLGSRRSAWQNLIWDKLNAIWIIQIFQCRHLVTGARASMLVYANCSAEKCKWREIKTVGNDCNGCGCVLWLLQVAFFTRAIYWIIVVAVMSVDRFSSGSRAKRLRRVTVSIRLFCRRIYI